ncbi:hypothetical protein BC941DRAFT_474498 [Chlamydoabsidia padenii]|nr:hypothetical protein BC941DRAFT_474498 [Chlamydoabsidia padenii]
MKERSKYNRQRCTRNQKGGMNFDDYTNCIRFNQQDSQTTGIVNYGCGLTNHSSIANTMSLYVPGWCAWDGGGAPCIGLYWVRIGKQKNNGSHWTKCDILKQVALGGIYALVLCYVHFLVPMYFYYYLGWKIVVHLTGLFRFDNSL